MSKEKKISVRITVRGAVQGIGYRPFAAGLARKRNLAGTVRNSGGIVILEVTGERSGIDLLEDALRREVPAGGYVVSLTEEPLTGREFDEKEGFSIIESSEGELTEFPAFPPDLGICPDCRREMLDPSNRRFRYGLISCTVCGPRWSILDRFPYDREHTAMRTFPMCPSCREEYTAGRRRHAQTISCHDCGPQMYFVKERRLIGETDPVREEDCRRIYGEEGFREAVRVLESGGILALKSVGGFQLLCSPFREESVQRLREMKRREKKPFAVLFSSVEEIRQYAEVSREEEKLLTSSAKPIVLLLRKEGGQRQAPAAPNDSIDAAGGGKTALADFAAAGNRNDIRENGNGGIPLAPGVCGESRYLGAFLPSFGVQELLLQELGPLVVTSANRSAEPIPFREEAFAGMEFAGGLDADGVYLHDRSIRRPLDDSVAAVPDGRIQMIRRSRGYVPAPVFLREAGLSGPFLPGQANPEGTMEKRTQEQRQEGGNGNFADRPEILAAGADLKAAFALAKKDRVILSQYFGDLSDYAAACNYREQERQMEKIFGAGPECVVCDLHPGYFSTRMAKEYAKEKHLPLYQVQHHQAHAASVMAEWGLRSCIGIVFDGTGCGTDGQLWGGELLYLCEGDFRRLGSLSDCRMPGGDALSVRADLAGDACLFLVGEKTRNPLTGLVLSKEEESRTIVSTSMGRLFDAAASLLGIGQENHYEGECAVLLENAAWRAWEGRTGEDAENPARAAEIPEKAADTSGRVAEIPERSVDISDPQFKRALARTLLSFRGLTVPSPDGRILLSTDALVRGLLEMKEKGKSPDEAALFFHLAVCYGTAQIAEKLAGRTGEKKICLSGGCFANRLLLSVLEQMLRKKRLLVYRNEQVPANDGGIALGQAYLAGWLHKIHS